MKNTCRKGFATLTVLVCLLLLSSFCITVAKDGNHWEWQGQEVAATSAFGLGLGENRDFEALSQEKKDILAREGVTAQNYTQPQDYQIAKEYDSVSKQVDLSYMNSEQQERSASSENPDYSWDYTTSNILQVAKPGDIAIQEEGFGGITGHAVVISRVTATAVYTIEAVASGVGEFQLDSSRFFDRRTTLFSVRGATPAQIGTALAWGKQQLGRKYDVASSTAGAFAGAGINCSTLAWAMYYMAGINIHNMALNALAFILPRDIRNDGIMNKKTVSYNAYKFRNQNSGKVMDMSGGGNKNGTQMIQYKDTGSNNQAFIMVSTPKDRTDFILMPGTTTQMLDVEQPLIGDGKANGRKIKTQGIDRNWKDYRVFWWSGNMLKSKNTGYSRCVVVEGASKNDAANLVQWDANGTSNGKWDRVLVGTYYFSFY
ncbi:MAG: RICIN domain-containing protein [Firmicutes bacterium]|nr:RICIN domain-containing protein [Bacillota bacterium]